MTTNENKKGNIIFKIYNNITKRVRGKGFGKIPGVKLIHDFLFRKLWSEGNIVNVQGSKFYVDVNHLDLSMRQTFQAYGGNKVHEKSTTKLFEKVIKKGNVVLDLGANIGYFTLLSARLVGPKGKVYAFEPEPRNFSFLKKNVELNNYTQVIVNQKAVGNKKGKVKLYICPYETGHHTINQFEGIENYTHKDKKITKKFVMVDLIVLDNFIKDKKIDFIKMDVEGAELLALRGMAELLEKNKNIKLVIEFFPLLIESMNSSPKEFINTLIKKHKFKISIIPNDYSAGTIYELVNTYDDLMKVCLEKEGHVNLFLKR